MLRDCQDSGLLGDANDSFCNEDATNGWFCIKLSYLVEYELIDVIGWFIKANLDGLELKE